MIFINYVIGMTIISIASFFISKVIARMINMFLFRRVVKKSTARFMKKMDGKIELINRIKNGDEFNCVKKEKISKILRTSLYNDMRELFDEWNDAIEKF